MPGQSALHSSGLEIGGAGVGTVLLHVWITLAAILVVFLGGRHSKLRLSLCHLQPIQTLFQPLPVPCRPWSHILVEFVTGLPCSRPKVPSAKESYQLLVQHVFHCQSLYLDFPCFTVYMATSLPCSYL